MRLSLQLQMELLEKLFRFPDVRRQRLSAYIQLLTQLIHFHIIVIFQELLYQEADPLGGIRGRLSGPGEKQGLKGFQIGYLQHKSLSPF